MDFIEAVVLIFLIIGLMIISNIMKKGLYCLIGFFTTLIIMLQLANNGYYEFAIISIIGLVGQMLLIQKIYKDY